MLPTLSEKSPRRLLLCRAQFPSLLLPSFSQANMPGVCVDLLSASRLLHRALPFLPKQTSFSSVQLVFRPLECSRLHISIGERFTPLSAFSFNWEGPPLWCTITALGSLVKPQFQALQEVPSASREVLFLWSRKQILSSLGVCVCKWLASQLCIKVEMLQAFPESRGPLRMS